MSNISIIILTYNKLDYTKKCLEALRKNTPKEFLKDIIIIDNKSSDGTQEYLRKIDWINFVENKINTGFAKGCNQGAKLAKGDILLFLNNDTEVQKGWLESLLKVLEKKDVAVVGSKLLFPDGLIQHAGIVIANDRIPRPIYYRESPDRPYVNKQREFKAVTAACLAVKRDIFQEVGGFDETYFNSMEDVDLCLKIFNKGYKIIYCPESVIIHHESVSPGRHDYDIKNNKLFLKKWSNEEPDEQKYYKEDGRSWLYRKDRELVNKYYNIFYDQKPLILQIPGFCYRFFHKAVTGISLLLRLDFQELKKRVAK